MEKAIEWHEKRAEHYRRIVASMRKDGCKTSDMIKWLDKMDHHHESASELRAIQAR